MNKSEYILKQIARTDKKNYENYVVTRIWHSLDNMGIKFVTQQYISRNNGTYALTDMFFPQIGLHIEVDEGHHKKQIQEDELREKDIISVTNHEIIRIDASKGLNDINIQIEKVVKKINNKINVLGDEFIPWDMEREYSPETYIQTGVISLKDNVAFRKSVDACNCFGLGYKGFYRGGTKHPVEKNTLIWFPKLYPNEEWDNRISPDGLIITERNMDPEKAKEHIREHIDSNIHRRIVFAKVKGELGDIMYRFKGVFGLNVEKSEDCNCLVWERIADKVKTYNPAEK